MTAGARRPCLAILAIIFATALEAVAAVVAVIIVAVVAAGSESVATVRAFQSQRLHQLRVSAPATTTRLTLTPADKSSDFSAIRQEDSKKRS